MITDEELSRFLDGELAEDEAETVRRAVAGDPGLAARLERLRAVDRVFADAVRVVDAAPTPAAVAAMLGITGPRAAGSARPARFASGWRFPAAIAATLAVGLFGGAALTSFGRPQMASLTLGALPAKSALVGALETTASGRSIAIDGAALRPLVTFRTTDGGLCREFRWMHGGAAAHGVACRNDGLWTVQVAAADESGAEDGYRAASTDAAIDAFVTSVIAGEPLDGDEERNALSAGRLEPAEKTVRTEAQDD